MQDITSFTADVMNISALDDDPIASGDVADSTALKAAFDQAGKDIKTWINGTLEKYVSRLQTHIFHTSVTCASWTKTTTDGVDIYTCSGTWTGGGINAQWLEDGVTIVTPITTDITKARNNRFHAYSTVIRGGNWRKSDYYIQVDWTIRTTDIKPGDGITFNLFIIPYYLSS